ncbi:MAG: pyruvate dehydrogenase complex dihydrolipoamide acetyltransferase [Alphaproteobacteria bacterium]|nr:pyruvate dehydrogenase complex dihydrolipoamide acetyltransferase [Alphaproteobacteria bacterium]
MPINILMPALSPTMTEGTLAKWLKKEGDAVKAGDVIAEIETDKATMEVEAVDEGKIGKILIAAGTAGVAVNTPIAVLLEDGESNDNIKAPAAAPKTETPKAEAPKAEAAPAALSAPAVKTGDRIFATPLARRIAKEKGINLANVKGSGPQGRIVKDDLGKAPATAGGGASPSAAPMMVSSGPNAKALATAYGMEFTETPNNNMRKIIAKRLLESKQTIPHFYLTIECRLDNLLAARAELNDAAKGAYKLSVNDFVIKAAAQALKAYPKANVAWTDDAILNFAHADISVAVATPNGLITPIIKAAETKGLQQISAEMKDLATRARDGKLKPEEFQGGTFSISNLGMYGVKDFAAIINPPQACILAVGAGVEQPVVKNGKIEIGTVMGCTLSVDHRAVDGAVGAEYLQIFKQYIENPVAMLV